MDELRIDKYLWAIRVFKTRSEATEACKGGKVKVAGIPAKPSRAIQAGTDILLSCHDPEVQQRIYRSTLQAVKDGKLSRTDIDASVRRIVYCKLKNFTDTAQREKLYKEVAGKERT